MAGFKGYSIGGGKPSPKRKGSSGGGGSIRDRLVGRARNARSSGGTPRTSVARTSALRRAAGSQRRKNAGRGKR